MKNTSPGGLFNLVELHHIIRNADEMFWILEGDGDVGMRHVLCDRYMTWRVALPNDSYTNEVILKRFNGQKPAAGDALRSVRARKRYVVSKSAAHVAMLQSILDAEPSFSAIDTGHTIDYGSEGMQIHAYYVCGWAVRERDYVFIDQKYRVCFNEVEEALANDIKRTSSLLFLGAYDERAVVMPVNTCKPQFLADLN